MSAWLPAGSGLDDGSANVIAGSPTTMVSGGVACSIDAAQQAQVQRTQNAGQPLSGADSVVPIGQLSGTRSELTPLASARSTASTARKNARRILVNISVQSCHSKTSASAPWPLRRRSAGETALTAPKRRP